MKFSPLCLLALALAAGCARPEPAATPAPLPAARVRVASGQVAAVPQHPESPGTVPPV